MRSARPFHYHNDGSGRDSYVNMASSTVARSGKIAERSAVLHDVLGCWPDPQYARERLHRDGLDTTLSPTPSMASTLASTASHSLRQSPARCGTAASPPSALTLERLLAAASPKRQLSPVRDGECSPNSSKGRVRFPAAHVSPTAQSPCKPLDRLHFYESTAHRAQRIGRFAYASNNRDVPPLEPLLPGIRRGPSYY